VSVAPRDERGDVERESHRVEQRVHHPEPARIALHVTPVVQPGERRRDGAEDPDRERAVRRLRADEVERDCRRPGAERHVRQRRVKRIAEPDAVEDVPHRLRDSVHGLLPGLGDLVEGLREVGQLFREAEIRHDGSRPRRI